MFLKKLNPRLAYQTESAPRTRFPLKPLIVFVVVSTSSLCPECVSQTVSFDTPLDDNGGVVCGRQWLIVGEPSVG